MRREIENIIALIETRCQARPAPMEFEMAYQARIAMDRIRFAIKHTEQFAPHTDQMREAGLQLLDALERLESVDRQFQKRSRIAYNADSETNNLATNDFNRAPAASRGNGRSSAD
jgi:hypothetical protein